MENEHSQQRRDGDRLYMSHLDGDWKVTKSTLPPDDRQHQPKLTPSEQQRDAQFSRWNRGRPSQSSQQSAQIDFRPRHQAFHTPRHSEGVNELPYPPPISQSPVRHLSHISALSSAQPSVYSRPISEISSEYVPTDALTLPDSAVGATGSKKFAISPSTTPHSKGRSRASTNASQSRYRPAGRKDAMPSSDAVTTMEQLTSAIRQGLDLSKASPRSTTPKPFSVKLRMPFQNEPESPTSVYADGIVRNRDTLPISSYQGYGLPDSKPSTITEHEIEDYEKFPFATGVPTPPSQFSKAQTLQNEGPSMSSKIPPSKRPPKLDIAAVREAEARGSMTSLSDLIKRATRLASNLDRGKTASRLGHLDMFGSSEKLDGGRFRNSTYSDVLAAFPPPADGTVTPGRDRPATMWPGNGKQFMMSKSSLGAFGDANEAEEKQRRYCGLSLCAFALTLTILVLLIAAAVLIPVFLIVLPKQHQRTLGDCSSSHSCRNNGIAVITSGQCSCICVGGFTGSDCSQQSDPECTTASIYDGTTHYENATIGTALLPILQPEAQIHGVPLNTTIILATFAANNLSCASENSLVVFNQNQNSQAKRSLGVIQGRPLSMSSTPVLIHKEQRRQDATQSANGIVFATSSQQSQPTATSAQVSATPVATGNVQENASNDTLNFAAAVVLYVLETNSEINAAVTAKQAMSTYFEEKSHTNHTVVVVGGSQWIAVNFDTFQIKSANGTNLGS